MSSDEKVLDFPRVEGTSEENARRVMIEATRLAKLAFGTISVRSLCLKRPFATTSLRSTRAWKIWCGASCPALPHSVADGLSSLGALSTRCLMDFSSDACFGISRAIAMPSRTCGKKWSASSRTLHSGAAVQT